MKPVCATMSILYCLFNDELNEMKEQSIKDPEENPLRYNCVIIDDMAEDKLLLMFTCKTLHVNILRFDFTFF